MNEAAAVAGMYVRGWRRKEMSVKIWYSGFGIDLTS